MGVGFMKSMLTKFMGVMDVPGNRLSTRIPNSGSLLPAAVLLSAIFLCGCIAGTFAASNISSGSEVSKYINLYIQMAREHPDTGSLLGLAFLNSFKYHVLAVLFGLSVLGVGLVPLVVLVRGFTLSFAVTSFVKVLGNGGFLLAFYAFGIQCIITLPCLIILASQALTMSASLVSNGRKKIGQVMTPAFFARLAICSLALAIAAVFEALFTPLLISSIADIF